MLKERVNYLCTKNAITRKNLVRGIITTTHFSNILSGRYLLADDIAENIAKRLNVTKEYLLRTDEVLEVNIKQADKLIEATILDNGLENILLESIDEENESLIIELTQNFCKACIYQNRGDITNYNRILKDYLQFYIDRFSEADINVFPIPLKKAFYYFKAKFYISIFDYENVFIYIDKLLPYVKNNIDSFVSVSIIKINALMKSGKFDDVNILLDNISSYIHKENSLYHLPTLYILRSNLYFQLSLFQESLVYLSKAEENLHYMKEQGKYYTTILNNRMVTLLQLEDFKAATIELDNFEASYTKTEQFDDPTKVIVELYRCDIHLNNLEWDKLSNCLSRYRGLNMTENQKCMIDFYEAHLHFHNGNEDEAQKLAESCLDHLEKLKKVNMLLKIYELLDDIENFRQVDTLIKTYELLGEITESQKKYKISSQYYKKVIELLKNN